MKKNISQLPCGEIGTTNIRIANGEIREVKVIKNKKEENCENYQIKNNAGELLGEIDVYIKKIPTMPWDYSGADASHVFVDNLRNYSKPGTPYYKEGLEYHKDIGTRLLQIALKRSYESNFNGALKLVTKGESKNWYIDYIEMQAEIAPAIGLIKAHETNNLYLPPENKFHLANLQGGL